MTIDILIIGQGLAGTHLAHQCLTAGLKTLILDQNHHQAASKIAAGMINPIKGKRLALLWDNESDYEESMAHYARLETQLNSTFLRPLDMVRLIDSEDTIAYYHKKLKNPQTARFLQNPLSPKDLPECHPYPLSLKIPGVQQLDTHHFLNESRRYFTAQNSLQNTRFNPEDLELLPNGVRYQDIQAKFIVFCEGHQATQNPFWKHLPFENALGTVLTLTAPGLKPNTIYNNGKWLCPLPNGDYKLGTTSHWDIEGTLRHFDRLSTPQAQGPMPELGESVPEPLNRSPKRSLNLQDAEPVEVSKDKEHTQKLPIPKKDITTLEDRLTTMLKTSYHIKHSEAGIRPVLKDRAPIATFHPEHPQIGIINGLGGHGCFYAPILAESLVKQIQGTLNQPH